LEVDPSISCGMENAERNPYECNYSYNGLASNFRQSE
jgi:hypothetical protein